MIGDWADSASVFRYCPVVSGPGSRIQHRLQVVTEKRLNSLTDTAALADEVVVGRQSLDGLSQFGGPVDDRLPVHSVVALADHDLYRAVDSVERGDSIEMGGQSGRRREDGEDRRLGHSVAVGGRPQCHGAPKL